MRKLSLKINDKDYELVMNRESIKWLENNGFVLEEFTKKPLTYMDMLWYSLFIANHGEVSPSLAMKLQNSYQDEKGMKMYNKVISFAIDEYESFFNALAGTNSKKTEEELEITEV